MAAIRWLFYDTVYSWSFPNPGISVFIIVCTGSIVQAALFSSRSDFYSNPAGQNVSSVQANRWQELPVRHEWHSSQLPGKDERNFPGNLSSATLSDNFPLQWEVWGKREGGGRRKEGWSKEGRERGMGGGERGWLERGCRGVTEGGCLNVTGSIAWRLKTRQAHSLSPLGNYLAMSNSGGKQNLMTRLEGKKGDDRKLTLKYFVLCKCLGSGWYTMVCLSSVNLQ